MNRISTAFLVCLIALAPGAVVAHDFEFSGSVSFKDVGDYLYLDFAVPAGTTKIDVAYSYGVAKSPPAAATGVTTGLLFGNCIDIGVFDPDGFRGWSGRNKSALSIAESSEATSDSYIPGPIQEGIWQVELGVGWVEPGSTLEYQVTVDLSDEPVGPVFEPPAYTPVVLSNEPGWYKGDLHCHSTHSDGSQPMGVVFDYALGRGLDFIALTDHNAISHMLYIPEHQANYPDMLLLYGVEVTTYAGHFNVFNIHNYVPYQATAPGYDINAVIDDVHAQGGHFSPNHPFAPGLPNVPRPGLIYGLGYGLLDTDWTKVDSWEAINGTMIWGPIQNLGNLGSLILWDSLQDKGFPIPLRGGSDDHSGGTSAGPGDNPIGTPTTVVYADNLSEQAIMDGIAAGHCYITAPGPDGPELYIEATAGKNTAIMGDTLAGDNVTLSIRAVGANGLTLDVLKDGEPLQGHTAIAVDQGEFTYDIALQPETPTRYRAELYKANILQAITNSLFVKPDAGDDDDDDDTTDDDDDDNDAADDDDDDNDAADDDDDDDNSGCGCS